MAEPLAAYKGGDPFVFVCYSHDDQAVVYPQLRWLQDQGVKLWYDEGISGGAVWRTQVGEALQQSSHVLYFLSPASVASDHCSREIHLALDLGMPVVPVYLQAVTLTADLMVGLSRVHALQLDAPRFKTQLLEAVTIDRALPAQDQAIAANHGKRHAPMLLAVLMVLSVIGVMVAGYLVAMDPAPPFASIIDRPMVAVLPITNNSGNPDFDSLSIGLMDEIIVGLQRFRSFPVVSRSATLSIADRNAPVEQIAVQLNAAYVMDASLRTNVDSIRILATLSDATGHQLWARRFDLDQDREMLFNMVDELGAAIAGAVRESEVERIAAVHRPDLGAWEHYTKALSFIVRGPTGHHTGALSERDQALVDARKAIELDPQMAEAWWALGELQAIDVMVNPPPEPELTRVIDLMVSNFRRAHDISPFHGAACGCLGMMLAAIGRAEEGFVLLEEALVANPMSSSLRVDYGQVLASQGRFQEAREMASSAARMEPMGKDLGVTYLTTALADLGQDRWETALANTYRALFAHQNNEMVMPVAMVLLHVLGDREGAIRTYSELQTAYPGFRLDNPFTVLMLKPIDRILIEQRGKRTELPAGWRQIVREIEVAASQQPVAIAR